MLIEHLIEIILSNL